MCCGAILCALKKYGNLDRTQLLSLRKAIDKETNILRGTSRLKYRPALKEDTGQEPATKAVGMGTTLAEGTTDRAAY